ncbi:MAG TPA: DUF1080 domain-containing protein [Chitinophagaceae bacterium]|jgi:hypothetical protein|nr:DUF1080 domain-containing protein [Chitinophagaceae bacterium]
MRPTILFALLCLLASCSARKGGGGNDGWIPLFDGKSLNGWRVNENPSTFRVENGTIVADGERSHLFYNGAVQGANFKNFELKVEVMTTPGSNSGIFFHTAFQPEGWPAKGYEVQVNNTQSDWRRTGSLYAVQDVREVFVKDNEWFTETIRVEGKRVTIKVNDRTVVDYTEPAGVEKEEGRSEKRLSNGTFALQGHDPKSKVYYRGIWVRPLPE